ncbi:MAG TPA: rhomboid family intramembrane serine protease [Acidimicrobiia bacterium]|jgi:membrane associated rhomboid family serine protease
MTFPEPPPTEERTTCFFHTDRETGRRCTRCGRPACWECLHDAPVGAHCWECLKAEQPPRSEQARRAVRSAKGDPMLVTKILIGLNVLVFAIDLVKGAGFGGLSGSSTVTAFEARWGYYNPAIAAGQWERIVTSGFIHFGFLHIFFNMLILWFLGQTMEAGIGRLRFTLIYFASLVAGSFAIALINDTHVNGGASGAIFGLAAAATIALYQRGVSFYQTGWGPLLIIELVLSFLDSNISIGAHVGGLVAGAILGAVMLHPRFGATNRGVGIAVAAAIIVGCSIGAVVIARDNYSQCTNGGVVQISPVQQVSVHDFCTINY